MSAAAGAPPGVPASASASASSSNAATRAFFRSGYGVALAVYDTRRGQQEGHEADKVLAFYPPTAPAVMQSSIVGLAQALTMFAGTFNKECPTHFMAAHKHLWTMYHAEPDLWLLLLVGRGLVGPHCQRSALASLAKGLHASAALLHGQLSAQLEQDPSGVRVRMRLQPLLQEAASSLLAPEQAGLRAISCPLGATGGVPLLPVSPGAFTRLQSLVNTLLVCRLYGARPVCGVLVAWQTCLLWSSLGSADTAALHSLAVRGIEPAAREGPRHRTWRRPMIAGARTQQQQQQQQQQRASPQPSLHSGAATQHSSGSSRSSGSGRSSPRLPQSTRSNSTTGTPDGWVGDAASAGAGAAGAGGGGAAAGFGATGDSISRRGDTLSVITGDGRGSATLQADVMSLALAATWQCRPDGMLQPVWLADRDAGSGSGSGSGARGAAGGCSQLPMVWLQSGCEPARLMAWHSGPLLFLLLLEPGAPTAASCAAVTAGLAEVLAAPAAALCASLAAELPAKNLWHVQGLRYLYEDHLAGAVRASPLRKVSTLAPSSLRLAAEARQAMGLEATAAADPTAPPLGAWSDGAVVSSSSSSSSSRGGGGGHQGAAAGGGSGGGSSCDGGGGSRGGAAAEAWEAYAAGAAEADVEVVVRGASDCWVVARHTATGRELTAVVESEREGLAGVMRRVQALCDAQCPGAFEGVA